MESLGHTDLNNTMAVDTLIPWATFTNMDLI